MQTAEFRAPKLIEQADDRSTERADYSTLLQAAHGTHGTANIAWVTESLAPKYHHQLLRNAGRTNEKIGNNPQKITA